MRISEAAKLTKVTPVTLRYYERLGLLPPVKRTRSNIRDYSEEDLQTIQFITCMRSAGLSIATLVKYTALQKQRGTSAQRKALLLAEQAKLIQKQQELSRTMEKLRQKIATLSKETTIDRGSADLFDNE